MEYLESRVDLSFGGQALPSVVETYSYLETEFMCESLGPGGHDSGLSKPKFITAVINLVSSATDH